jgi:hypothetical protein
MARPKSPPKDDLTNVFEQRAEYLSAIQLKKWTPKTERDSAIVAKLLSPGAKLLIGPRGSGKSTLLRTAYFEAMASSQSLAVYVNYANSLALEPLFHRQANALQIFRQWLLCKIIVATLAAFDDLKTAPPKRLLAIAHDAKDFVLGFESGGIPQLPDETLSPQFVTDLLEGWCDDAGLNRCILLMDDAAHAFSPEQQREFFEVFRGLRSRRVAGKAAVYPGITTYSANFHAGHDAELIEVWSKCDQYYLESMREVVKLRLPEALQSHLESKTELVNLLALASFGLPRGFLNMLSYAFGIEEGAAAASPTRRRAHEAIEEHAESVRALFTSLRAKLPRFTNFVEAGIKLEAELQEVLKGFNKLKEEPEAKTNVVAIKEPIDAKFERVLNMLEYAGVVRAERRVSRGVKGSFRRYSLHNAVVVAENVLSLGKSYSIKSLVTALATTSAHAFARTNPAGLLGKDFEATCTLNLPNCTKCGSARFSEEQRFCMKCGAELASASLYEELLRAKVENLPLTKKKLQGIRECTDLDTIQDILIDDDKQTLLDVPYIGPVWAARIRTLAEEFISV